MILVQIPPHCLSEVREVRMIAIEDGRPIYDIDVCDAYKEAFKYYSFIKKFEKPEKNYCPITSKEPSSGGKA